MNTNRKCRLTLEEAKRVLNGQRPDPDADAPRTEDLLMAACNTIVSLYATLQAYEEAAAQDGAA